MKASVLVVIVASRSKAASDYTSSLLPRILILFITVKARSSNFPFSHISKMEKEASGDWLTYGVRVTHSPHP